MILPSDFLGNVLKRSTSFFIVKSETGKKDLVENVCPYLSFCP